MPSSYILQQDGGRIGLEDGDGFLLLDQLPESIFVGADITNRQTTILSYLYFQYIDDANLPALINAYNTMTQRNVNWFNSLNLPIYPLLSGALLDWVGQGLYGYTRPLFSSTVIPDYNGAIDTFPTDNLAIGQTDFTQSETIYTVPDDIYKRTLTWLFYKGDGHQFSISWLKRRLYRFLYAPAGWDIHIAYMPMISITFESDPVLAPLCTIVINDAPNPVGKYLEDFINSGLSQLPFRFRYQATVNMV